MGKTEFYQIGACECGSSDRDLGSSRTRTLLGWAETNVKLHSQL
jgi:hypothetical protein